MKTSIIDFTPEYLYRAHEELVRNLLPQAWWSRMIPREITAWAHLFAIGGMAVYDSALAWECGHGACRGESVGTFVVIGPDSYFVGSDEKGVWCYWLGKANYWSPQRTCALFLRTCSGPVDARADTWHARISNLNQTLHVHATANTAFRALLSLGRLYDPSVNKDLRYTPCISEHSELYSEYQL